MCIRDRPKEGSQISILGKVVFQELSISEKQLYVQEIEVQTNITEVTQ